VPGGGTYFFTVNLLERHIAELREAVRVTWQERPFRIDAWVVLPDHMHCVWTLPPGDDDYSNRWKVIKICFVRALSYAERRSHVRVAKGERGIWKRRFWEHTIRNEADEAKQAVFEYIEVFYNRERLHSANDYLSPLDFELQHKAA
jgi:putative transposase